MSRLEALYALRERVTAAIAYELDHPAERGPGRPEIPITLTAEAARECHRLYAAGYQDPAVIDGERQYQRAHKRAARRRKDVA